jgi:hypothetical protein
MPMSNAPVHEPPPLRKARSRWRRRIIFLTVAAAGSIVAVVGLYVYLDYAAQRELLDAIAEADRLDPHWRFEALQDERVDVPDAENSALLIAAAYSKIPKNFLAIAPDGSPTIADQLADLSPDQRLDAAQLNNLRGELAKVGGAVTMARDIADRPRGRWAVTWNTDFLIATLVPHMDQVQRVRHALVLDGALASAEGATERAMRDCRAVLNTGRSLGDEPMLISQIVRTACAMDAVRALERCMAQGQASEADLVAVQRLLADEAAAPTLLIAMRGDRAAFFQSLEAMRTARFNRAVFMMKPSRLGERFDIQRDRLLAQGAQPARLRHGTALVEIVKRPTHEQEDQLRKLAEPKQMLPPLLEGLTRSTDWTKLVRRFHRAQAAQRCAETAMAAERYRLAEQRWPDNLNALVPRFLAAVPADPFDGQPLRLRCLPDGIVIYSVGPDRTDDDGQLDRSNADAPGTDIGFQLWDAERRVKNAPGQ